MDHVSDRPATGPASALGLVGARTAPKWRARTGEETPQRREQIIRAATKVLGRQGYAAASLKEIAREANVAPGLLHYYFESKDDLLLEVVAVLHRERTDDWQSAISGIEDPLERVIAALDRCAMIAVERPEYIRLLFDVYTLGQTNQAMRLRIEALRSERIDNIEAEVRGIFGQLPAYAVVAPRKLAEALAGACDGIAMTALIEQKDSRPAYHALKAMLLSMVVTAYVATGQPPPFARLQDLLATGVD